MGDAFEAVDLDASAETDAANPVQECSCGQRRAVLRNNAISPCAGRALAKLKAAHPDEYNRYLTELRAEALAAFERNWQRHLCGDYHRR
jgi:hypothetical protein